MSTNDVDILIRSSYLIEEMKCPANITTVVAGAANPLLITICFIFYTLDETIPAPRQDSLKLDFNMRGMQDVTSVGVQHPPSWCGISSRQASLRPATSFSEDGKHS